MPVKRAPIPTQAFREELNEIALRRRELQAEDDRLARRSEWLKQGIEYAEGEPRDGVAREILPPPGTLANGRTRPTIRQAIVLVMNAYAAERIWRPGEVIAELDSRGWLPEAPSARQMVRNRMLSMVERGELERRDPGGYYKLADHIRDSGLLRAATGHT